MKNKQLKLAAIALLLVITAFIAGCAKTVQQADIGGTHMDIGDESTPADQTTPDTDASTPADEQTTPDTTDTTPQNNNTPSPGTDDKKTASEPQDSPKTEPETEAQDGPGGILPSGDGDPVLEDEGPGTVIKIISQNLMSDGSYDNVEQEIKSYSHSGTIADARVRQPVLKEVLTPYDADSMGFQEVTYGWKTWLKETFPGYTQSGIMRYGDNYTGNSANQANLILYKTDKFELVREETVWLSSTPYVPGTKDWGGSPCTFSYVQLKVKSTGEQIVHFNTRFSSSSGSARSKSGALLSKYVNDFIGVNGDLAMYASGDFNVTPGETAYNEMIGMFADPVNVTDNVIGSGTSNLIDFEDYVPNPKPGARLDYIFINPTAVVVDKYEVIDKIVDGVRPANRCGIYLESRIYRSV